MLVLSGNVSCSYSFVLLSPFFFSLSFFGSPVPFASGPPIRTSSWFFPVFLLFSGFRALPSSSVGLVPLFLSQAVVFHLSSFFLFGVPFSFFSGLFPVLSYLLSSGSSLGWVCPALGVLVGVSSFGFSSYVSQCYGPPGCFFRGFPPLPVLLSPFSPVARSPSVVRYGFLPRSLSELSQRSLLLASLPGCFSPCITFWHVWRPGLALLLLRCVRSWGRFAASLRWPSFLVLFVLFLFSYACCFSSLSYWWSFRFSSYSFSSSFSCCPHLFVQHSLQILLLVRRVLLFFRSPLPLLLLWLPLFVLVPRFMFLGFGVSLLLGLSL